MTSKIPQTLEEAQKIIAQFRKDAQQWQRDVRTRDDRNYEERERLRRELDMTRTRLEAALKTIEAFHPLTALVGTLMARLELIGPRQYTQFTGAVDRLERAIQRLEGEKKEKPPKGDDDE